ncbi:hypothetical protein PFMALIP_00412 [Plasmodium falciparum MaliPS096_E11]|uniref:Uncharacterized protein n=3 Tax=Plasmodium falciparum TaxID=5833 RepID=A0A024XFH8_PLAFC|nr:hypothetical protein PFFVO_00394 [Plasmodium falciparum Vietnam Oak-Knoll (FVO)]ETW51544.1 hypothetical protein PFMALIP_00412 [Plasmodium falciparum MaliPS096_E11]ETW63646.1 hypothetical protein PFMC_00393 [Plasmodium falciparum CAMP/Malaysia]
MVQNNYIEKKNYILSYGICYGDICEIKERERKKKYYPYYGRNIIVLYIIRRALNINIRV